MKLVHLGIVIVEARGRVTPGLCFELRLSPGGRYAINLGHQLEAVHKSNCRRVSTRLNHDLHAIDATPARWRAPGGLSPLDLVTTVAFSPWLHPTHWLITHRLEGIGPLLAAGVREQPVAIVATHAPPMPYFEGAFQAVFPGTTLVKGAAPARLCRTTKTFKGSGGQGKNFGIGPAAKDLTRRAYAFCNKKLAPPPPATKATIVHLARGGGAGINGRHLVNANASLATLLKVFPNASVVERTTHGGETHFCGQLMFDAATVVLTAHGSHVVAALFAPVNTIVLEVMPWDMWTGRGFSYGGANKYLAGTGVVFDRVRSVKPLHPSKAVQKSNFKRPTPSTRRCRHDCVCLMAWGGTSRNNFQMVISTQIKGRGAFLARPRHDRLEPPRGSGGAGEGTSRGCGGDTHGVGRHVTQSGGAGGAASKPDMCNARQERPRGQGEMQTGERSLLQRASQVLRKQRV